MLEAQIAELKTQQENETTNNKSIDMRIVMQYIKYFFEHLEHLLLQQMNPIAKASYFGVLFDTPPTYYEIAGLGTPKLATALELNRLFVEKNNDSGHLAEREGFEPSVPLPAHLFSRQANSTTLAPLQLTVF